MKGYNDDMTVYQFLGRFVVHADSDEGVDHLLQLRLAQPPVMVRVKHLEADWNTHGKL